jgi:hypothetical protein
MSEYLFLDYSVSNENTFKLYGKRGPVKYIDVCKVHFEVPRNVHVERFLTLHSNQIRSENISRGVFSHRGERILALIPIQYIDGKRFCMNTKYVTRLNNPTNFNGSIDLFFKDEKNQQYPLSTFKASIELKITYNDSQVVSGAQQNFQPQNTFTSQPTNTPIINQNTFTAQPTNNPVIKQNTFTTQPTNTPTYPTTNNNPPPITMSDNTFFGTAYKF